MAKREVRYELQWWHSGDWWLDLEFKTISVARIALKAHNKRFPKLKTRIVKYTTEFIYPKPKKARK